MNKVNKVDLAFVLTFSKREVDGQETVGVLPWRD